MIRIGVLGFLAYEAVSRLARGHRKMLEEAFPRRFLDSFDALAKEARSSGADGLPAGTEAADCVAAGGLTAAGSMSAAGQAAAAGQADTSGEAAAAGQVNAVAWGGFYGTVWRALDALEASEDLPFVVGSPVGCRIDLRQIPLRQEIIEICELFEENPYEADSAGAYLVIWDEDRKSAAWFHMGDPSKDRYEDSLPDEHTVPAGYITESRDRLIINGDMVRYLTPHERQMTDICSRKKDRRSTDGKKR